MTSQRAQILKINGKQVDYIPKSLGYYDGTPTRTSTMTMSGNNLRTENFEKAPYIEFQLKTNAETEGLVNDWYKNGDGNVITLTGGEPKNMGKAGLIDKPEYKDQEEITIRFEGSLIV